jgi:hypothetical protein
MTELAERLDQAGRRRPETRFLGEMFHRSADDDDGALQEVRDQVEAWLRQALLRGRGLGVIRNDLPDELLAELTVGVLHSLDRWAIAHKHPLAPERSMALVRDLIEQR